MELYLFSGFLGSGKTTTIIALSKFLMAEGKKVGVVTNDQGKYLVDTAFMKANEIPAVDVQSGCFCSNYQDLVEQLDELKTKVDPDVIFAESIGSAGNLVGTVMSPLLQHSTYKPRSLVCLVDARLLIRILNDEYLPFSDSVNATFMNQLIESDALIINKLDLVNSKDISTIISRMPIKFNSKEYILQSAFSQKDIAKTFAYISKMNTHAKEDFLFDAHLHQKALDRLEWDEEILELNDENNVKNDIIELIENMLAGIKAKSNTIAHIKILIESPGDVRKLSISALDADTWKHEFEGFEGKTAKIIINSRIQS